MYNDEDLPTFENFERMAKEYSNNLKNNEYKLFPNTENASLLVDDMFDLLFKLRSSYRFLNGFLGSDKLLNLTENQIESLRELFSFRKNRGFRIRVNSTKCFLNTISLETKLLLTLNILAQFDKNLLELSKVANDRLCLLEENYKVVSVFANLSNMNLN